MSGNFMAEAVSFFDDGARFVTTEIHVAVKDAIEREEISMIRIIFDPIGAVLDLLADGEARAIHSVNNLDAMRQIQLPGKTGERISSRGRHGARGDDHMRAGDFTSIDGGFYVHVRVHRAFGFKITHGGEAVIEGDERVAGGKDRAVGN